MLRPGRLWQPRRHPQVLGAVLYELRVRRHRAKNNQGRGFFDLYPLEHRDKRRAISVQCLLEGWVRASDGADGVVCLEPSKRGEPRVYQVSGYPDC